MLYIAVFLGESKLTYVEFNNDGSLVDSYDVPYSERRISPQPGWFEIEPTWLYSMIIANYFHTIERARRRGEPSYMYLVNGVLFSVENQGIMAVDKNGNALDNFIFWSDNRAMAEANDLLREGGKGEELYQRTGVPIDPTSPLVKLIWLRNHRPEVFKAAYKFMGLKEFVWLQFTGRYEIDTYCAATTGLLNLKTQQWDELALETAGISPDKLPALVPFNHNSKPLKSTYFLNNPDYALGVNYKFYSPENLYGKLKVSLDSTLEVRTISDRPVPKSQWITYCEKNDSGKYVVVGKVNYGVNIMEWLRTDVFKSSKSPEEFLGEASSIPQGAEGLIFSPFLDILQEPKQVLKGNPGFSGLTAKHTQAHFVRAAMEAIMSDLKSISDELMTQTTFKLVFADGAFAENRYWFNILAETLNRVVMPVLPVVRVSTDSLLNGAFSLIKSIWRT